MADRMRVNVSDRTFSSAECQDCGTSFERPAMYGRAPKRCPACMQAWGAERQAAFRARQAEQTPRCRLTCPDCGDSKERTPGHRGPASSRCVSCKFKVDQARGAAKYRRKAGPAPVQPPCVDCGAALVRKGPVKMRCDECKRAKVAAVQLAKYRAGLVKVVPNPDAAKRRRVKLRGNTVEYFKSAEIYERDGWVCQLCEKPVPKDVPWPKPASASLDHIIPVSLGGAHSRANVQLAHLRCNLSKGAKIGRGALSV